MCNDYIVEFVIIVWLACVYMAPINMCCIGLYNRYLRYSSADDESQATSTVPPTTYVVTNQPPSRLSEVSVSKTFIIITASSLLVTAAALISMMLFFCKQHHVLCFRKTLRYWTCMLQSSSIDMLCDTICRIWFDIFRLLTLKRWHIEPA